MKSKRTIKHKSKYRKKPSRNGKTMKKYRKTGGDILKPYEQKDVEAYKNIIDDYIARQEENKKNGKANLEAVKYSLFKKKLDDTSKITKKPTNTITQDELDKLKSIVFFIIKDDVNANEMYFDEKSAGFQIWIDNFVKYLRNDAPFEDEIIVKLIEGIKKKPYVKMTAKKKYNHFISDVNNLFGAIKSEFKNEKPPIIKESSFKVNAKVGPIP
jgi:hypothetical protein